MQIVLGIFIVASVLELRSLFRQKERREAVLYIVISAAAVAIFIYLMLNPRFFSFARMMNTLFGAHSGGGA